MKKISVLSILFLCLFFVSSNALAQDNAEKRLKEILVGLEKIEPKITELEKFSKDFHAQLKNNQQTSKETWLKLLTIDTGILDLCLKTIITQGVIHSALGEKISDPLLDLQILMLEASKITPLQFGEKMLKIIKRQIIVLNQEKERLLQ